MLTIDVVVRTRADKFRSEMLFHALDSVQNQAGVSARPIVIVNGPDFDNATLAALAGRPGILLQQQHQASAALARAEGRRLVTAPYFSYLDDDDALIAGSLEEPLRWITAHPDCDALISNGYFVKEGSSLSELTHISDHISQPALSLLRENWLQPGAFIFRTGSIPSDLLTSTRSHMEWTRLAFELCATNKRIHFLDVPTVLYNDTPGSESKKLTYAEAALDLLQITRRDARLSSEVRRKANGKYFNTLHTLAVRYWQDGEYKRAWRCHFQSMRPPHTLKYLLFSRKLLWPFGARNAAKTPASNHPSPE